jgi:FkbM family methyltransferase
VATDLCTRPYHRPPPDLRPASIVDLGANIGLTMADMAVLYPGARIVGVELDPANADLARRNVAQFGERCDVIAAAVWTDDGTVPYQAQAGAEWTSRIDRGDHPDGWTTDEVRSISLNSLLAEVGHVDFMKMDIEGAEREVLQGDCSWAKHVTCINVEAHHPYAVSECLADLRRIGFDAAVRHDDSGIAHVIGRAIG